MFELLGWAVIRFLGYGRLWGVQDYWEHRGEDYFGNGGDLLLIGLASLLLSPFLWVGGFLILGLFGLLYEGSTAMSIWALSPLAVIILMPLACIPNRKPGNRKIQ